MGNRITDDDSVQWQIEFWPIALHTWLHGKQKEVIAHTSLAIVCASDQCQCVMDIHIRQCGGGGGCRQTRTDNATTGQVNVFSFNQIISALVVQCSNGTQNVCNGELVWSYVHTKPLTKFSRWSMLASIQLTGHWHAQSPDFLESSTWHDSSTNAIDNLQRNQNEPTFWDWKKVKEIEWLS